MKTRILKFLVGFLLIAVAGFSRAEDIDLFQGTTADQTIPPNLLIVIDNAANFSSSASFTCKVDGVTRNLSLAGTTGGVEQCALYNVVSKLDLTSPINLGFMVYNGNNVVDYNNVACQGSNGGCLVFPLTRISTEAERTSVLDWLASWKTSNGGGAAAGSKWIKANSQATGAVMQEAYAYLYGRVGLSGRDYALTTRPNINCKNFVVFIGNAYDTNSTPGDATGDAGPKNALLGLNSTSRKNAEAPLPSSTDILTLSSGITPANTKYCGTLNFPNQHENAGYYQDEWARYMATKRITTYTVGLLSERCQPEYAWLLSSTATAGGGTFFPTYNYTELIDALNTIVSEVRSVNSVFAAVSLPVSVNSQGTYLNQVFIGMFRPDPNGLPRWYGNLKQYRMGFWQGAFSLLDAGDTTYPNGRLAISSSGSEFIAECARSFWTPTTEDDYWSMSTLQNCSSTSAKSNFRDGNVVEKGAQAYVLRKTVPANRVVKTCPTAVADCQGASGMTNFNTSNTALLNTTTFNITPWTNATETLEPTPAELIDWARGTNNRGEVARKNGTPTTAGTLIASTDMRPSAHGDVVHSRPAAINFGTDADPKVVVFYGGNDGMLRAINGNRTASFNVNSSPVEPGAEFWSFLPPEFYKKIYRRWVNEDRITTAMPKDYAMDGPITAYRPTPTSDAWLFVGLRRGGNTMYAFKVDRTTLNITLMWKRGCFGSSCDSTGSFNQMGQTWSAPQVFTARGVGGGTTPLLIVGGGYDSCEDASPASCGSTKGNRYYVINAETGAHVATFNTQRAVIADVTIVPDAQGHAKYIYGVDLGGNIYRISGPYDSSTRIYADIGTNTAANWVMTTVASVGCDTAPTCSSPPNRKFMFAPDVVLDGSDYWLLLGSGDREKPTNINNATANYFFGIKDRPDLGQPHLRDAACASGGFDGLCLAALSPIARGATGNATDIANKKGWYLALNSNEQVVTGAIAVFGTVYFTTHEPQAAASNACVPNLGRSRAYAVKYKDAANARSSAEAYIMREDAGLAPDLVVGKVTLDDNSTVPFCIGCDGPIKPSQPIPPGLINNPAKIRSYWYLQK